VRQLHQCCDRALQSALEETGANRMPGTMAAEQGVVIRDLVTQDQYLNLVIPYGVPAWCSR